MRYCLNQPDVIQETIDGEVLIVHTPSGLYYSLLGTGVRIWEALLAGCSLPEIASRFADDGENGPAAIRADLERFVGELLQERLLLPDETRLSAEHPWEDRPPFARPILQKFTDMQELLLVDPIHEVDPKAGWPAPLAQD